jgi:ABC-type Fe3+-siderophore transport system permease subunit
MSWRVEGLSVAAIAGIVVGVVVFVGVIVGIIVAFVIKRRKQKDVALLGTIEEINSKFT